MKNWSVPAPGFFRFGGTKNRQIFGKRDPNIFSPAAVFFSKHSLVGWFFEIGRLKRVQGEVKNISMVQTKKNFEYYFQLRIQYWHTDWNNFRDVVQSHGLKKIQKTNFIYWTGKGEPFKSF